MDQHAVALTPSTGTPARIRTAVENAETPKEIVAAICKEMDGWEREAIAEAVAEAILDGGDDMIASTVKYAAFRLVGVAQRRPNPMRAVEAARSVTLDAITQRVRSMLLLELEMPSGKTLGQSDAADCRAAGGWMMELARRLSPGQTVADVFDEPQLKLLYAAAAERGAVIPHATPSLPHVKFLERA